MKTIEQQVADLGWDLVYSEPRNLWRAVQSGFSTPWRETQDDVLKDLQEQARIEKALDKAQAKLAD